METLGLGGGRDRHIHRPGHDLIIGRFEVQVVDHLAMAVPDHVQGDIEQDDKTDIANPAMLMQQLGDPGRGNPHQGNG
mgnify:CR=1 FL=1